MLTRDEIECMRRGAPLFEDGKGANLKTLCETALALLDEVAEGYEKEVLALAARLVLADRVVDLCEQHTASNCWDYQNEMQIALKACREGKC